VVVPLDDAAAVDGPSRVTPIRPTPARSTSAPSVVRSRQCRRRRADCGGTSTGSLFVAESLPGTLCTSAFRRAINISATRSSSSRGTPRPHPQVLNIPGRFARPVNGSGARQRPQPARLRTPVGARRLTNGRLMERSPDPAGAHDGVLPRGHPMPDRRRMPIAPSRAPAVPTALVSLEHGSHSKAAARCR
jgi:hypothetical protein